MHPEASHFLDFCRSAYAAQYHGGKTLNIAKAACNASNVGGPGAVSPFRLMSDAQESCEVIIVTECFQHDEDYTHSLQRMVEMLMPGGLCIFTCAAAGRSADHGAATPGVCTYYRGLYAADVLAIKDHFRPYFRLYYNAVSKDLYFVGIKNGRAPATHSIPTYDAPGVTLVAGQQQCTTGQGAAQQAAAPADARWDTSGEDASPPSCANLDMRLRRLQDRVAELEAETEERLGHLSGCMEDMAWRLEQRVDKLQTEVDNSYTP